MKGRKASPVVLVLLSPAPTVDDMELLSEHWLLWGWPQGLGRARPKMPCLTIAELWQVVKFQCQASHSSLPLVT